MDFYEVVRKRQSVRVYRSDPIPEDVLNRVLEAFRLSPSWANTQAWELILVKDPEIKAQLQKTVSDRNPSYAAMVDAPIIVCAIGITGRSGFYKGQVSTGRGDWVMFDLGIATEHLALAAAAEGLGTVHIGYINYEKAAEILELPKDRTVIEFIPIGYPAFAPNVVPRKSLSDFIFTDKYGKK